MPTITAIVTEVQARCNALTNGSTITQVLDCVIAAKKVEAAGGVLTRTVLDAQIQRVNDLSGSGSLIEDLIALAAMQSTTAPAVVASYLGQVAPIPLPSSGIYSPGDGSAWLTSGAVVPAAQAAAGLNATDLRCVKAALDISLPLTLTTAARFANTSTVTWVIDANNAAAYTTDGITWSNITPTGGAPITNIIGFRNLGASVEVFAASGTNLFRAVITNAAPGTVAWSSVASITNSGNFSTGAGFAFDGTTYLICWPSSSQGLISVLKSTNGTSWSEDTVVATDAHNSYKCLVATKPGGGFRVALTSTSGDTGINVYSTTAGASFAKLNASPVYTNSVINAARSLFVYIGTRLFLFMSTSAQSENVHSQFSDDDGATWGTLGAKLNLPVHQITAYGSGGAYWDGTRLAYVAYVGSSCYLVSTTNGVDFKTTQLFLDFAEIAAFSVGHLIGERFVFVPPSSPKNKLFNIKNAFTPNAGTDFVGMAARNVPQGATNLIFAARIL